MERTLIVGDIHSCHAELLELMQKAGITANDTVIALGDLIDRGPEPAKVLDLFMNRPRALCLLGNHERKHLLSVEGKVKAAFSQKVARAQLGEESYARALKFFRSLPLYLDLPEALLVHGFFEPGVPLSEQKENVLAGAMSGEYHLRQNYPWPWYENLHENKPLVFGHLVYDRSGRPLALPGRYYGLDTGCCHEGFLTGLLLPEFEILQVKARANYWPEIQKQYLHLKSGTYAGLTWTRLENVARRDPKAAEALARGQKALEELLAKVARAQGEVLAELQNRPRAAEGDQHEMGRAYALAIKGHPLQSLLFQHRKGNLDIAALKKRFKTPAALGAADL